MVAQEGDPHNHNNKEPQHFKDPKKGQQHGLQK
jgi:hypothetical protein